MAKRKTKQPSEYPEKLKRVTKLPSAPLCCPVCNVTLRLGTVAAHYQQELDRVQAMPPPPRQRKRTSSQAGLSKGRSEQSLTERAQAVLDTVRRRRFLFEHPSEVAGPSCPPSNCSVCGVVLPADQEAASSHVASCLAERGEESSGSEDESYEEYTWCNVTRVRATSLLSPQARADMFNGIVMSNVGDTSIEVDVVDDDTTTYGPAQYSETHIQECVQSVDTSPIESDQKKTEGRELVEQFDGSPISTVQCLICMGGYTEPLVSVICWHVYCEKCWLQALKAQKLCPKCKRITCAGDLRRIFL